VSSHRVELLYFDGCPHWRVAEARLRQVLLAGGRGGKIELRKVATPEQALRLEFRGSPSILIDGRDPFAGESAPIGLACRVYKTEDGPQGSPTVAQLRAALG
jgi:hypothetical protein